MTAILNIVALGLMFLFPMPSDIFCHEGKAVSYAFRYSIDEATLGVVLQHWEQRTEDLVFGSYSFVDSDGRVRVVTYEVNGPRGFKAVVSYRRPEDHRPPKGHLVYPKNFISPIRHAQPVGFITEELFHKRKSYPNLAI